MPRLAAGLSSDLISASRAIINSCFLFPQSIFVPVTAHLLVRTLNTTATMAAISPAVAAQSAVQKKPEGFDLYSRFALAGALGCSITHGAFTPVDVYSSIISGPATMH